jgi:hypothetical protein
MNFTRICIEGGGDRRVGTWVRLMVRRVGALPVAEGGSLAALGARS